MKNKYESLSTKDLKKEHELIYEIIQKRENENELKKQKKLNINDITAKDIAVRYTREMNEDDVRYSFYIKHERKLYDIYYEHSTYSLSADREQKFHPWWPIRPLENGETEYDDWDHNGARDFIPIGFQETCENMYEYDGSISEVIKHLKNHGITDVKEFTYEEKNGISN